jgi:hypothetical protein
MQYRDVRPFMLLYIRDQCVQIWIGLKLVKYCCKFAINVGRLPRKSSICFVMTNEAQITAQKTRAPIMLGFWLGWI